MSDMEAMPESGVTSSALETRDWRAAINSGAGAKMQSNPKTLAENAPVWERHVTPRFGACRLGSSCGTHCSRPKRK